MLEIKKCYICNGDMKKFLVGKDYWYETSNKEYTIVKCTKCGLEEINPMPSHEEQFNFYPQNYYSYENKKTSKKSRGIVDSLMKVRDLISDFFVKKGFNIRDYAEGNGKFFLDVGCGEGINIDIMQNKGWKSFGFEIGKLEKKGNIFYGSNISEIDRGILKFDLIYMTHVFEHVDSPQETLGILKSLLKDNGQLIITVPNSSSLSAFLYRQYAPERDIPRHLFTYNKKNLLILMNKSGFVVESYSSLRQFGLLTGFSRFIKDKLNFDLSTSKLRYLFFFFPLIELLLTILGYTNHLGFLLKKNK